MKRLFAIMFILILIIVAFYIQFSNNKTSKSYDNQNLAYDFQLSSLTHGDFKLSQLKGKPIVLNFWATWCEPCENEMPVLEKFHQEFKEDVLVLGLNITSQELNEKSVQKFVDELNVSFPILLDTKGVFRQYQVIYLPTTFFIDSNGIIVDSYTGELTGELLKEFGEKLK